MSVCCQETAVALSVWSPRGGDLPDAIALHIDSCSRCQAAFDDIFPRWSPPQEALVARPPAKRSGRLLVLAALSAAGLLLVPTPPPLSSPIMVRWDQPGESILTADDLFSTPECPLTTDLEHPVCEIG